MATKGMGANPLARSKHLAGRSLVSALSDSAGIMMVPLARIAPNPDNPPARMADVEALTESVREVGVLQQLLLVPVDVFRGAHPEHTAVLDGYEWVILAGHRRHAAAAAAGLEEVPVAVRRDLSEQGRDDEVLLHENLHRKELTPLEEARGYARMAQRGLSQRAIAKHTGISQGQIAKRLSLLKLSPAAQAVLEEELLQVVEALDWAKEPVDVQNTAAELLLERADAPQGASAAVLRDAQVSIRQRHRRAAAESYAAAEGLAVYQGLDAVSGFQTRAVTNPQEIEAARARGDLFVEAGKHQDEPGLVTTHRLEDSASDYKQREREYERERKRSMKAREACLNAIAGRPPSARDVGTALVSMTLGGGGLGSQITTRARRMAQAAQLGPNADSDWSWREQLPAMDRGRGHVAWLIYLAWLEDQARAAHRSWDRDQVAYLDLLSERGGYVPTQWEQEQIVQVRHEERQGSGDE